MVATVGAVGASAGLFAGLPELSLGPTIRAWIGNKEATTRPGW